MEKIKHMNSLMSDMNSLEFTDGSHSGFSLENSKHHQRGGYYDESSSDDENYSEQIDRLFSQTSAQSMRHRGGAAYEDSDDVEFVDPDYLFTDEMAQMRGGGISSIERDFLGMYKKAEEFHRNLADIDDEERHRHHHSQQGGDGFSSEYDNFFMFGGKKELNPKIAKQQEITKLIKDKLQKENVPWKIIQKTASFIYKEAEKAGSTDPEKVIIEARKIAAGDLKKFIEMAQNAPQKPKKAKKAKKHDN